LPVRSGSTLEPAHLYHALLHELIHLERRDAWAMCLAELFRALFWFHPAAWWLCARADLLRELSCDALVVERTGHPRIYARGLVACAERMRRAPSPLTSALPSWTGSKSQFSRRIEMLLQHESIRESVPWHLRALIGGLFALFGWGQLALAAAAPQERFRPDEAVPPAPPAPPAPATPPTWSWNSAQEDSWTPAPPDRTAGDDERRGRIARATELLERALARNPEDEDLRSALELLQEAHEHGGPVVRRRYGPAPEFGWDATPERRREAQRHAEEARRELEEARRAQLDAERHRREALRAYGRFGREREEFLNDEDGRAELERSLRYRARDRAFAERNPGLEELRARIAELEAQIEALESRRSGRDAPAPLPRGAR
jgi:hypothetical protein